MGRAATSFADAVIGENYLSSRNKRKPAGSPGRPGKLITVALQAKFGIDESPRDWPIAIGWGVVITGVMLVFAVVVNIWIGRTIHWDWVAGFGFLSFMGLSVGRRARII